MSSLLTPDIPLTVIGGYLGAGKTTLVNHLITNPKSPRLAIIVNDFGALNIDESLIKSRDGDTVSLTNGCVCCSLSNALADGLSVLLDRCPKPEHIVLEASGVAEPRRVAQYGLLISGVRLAAVIGVADAETVEAQAKDKFVGPLIQTQLCDADLIVLSKTDLISDQRRVEVRGWVEKLVPAARLIETGGDALPLSVLLGEGDLAPPKSGPGARMPVFHSWSYVSDQAFDADKVKAVLEKLPSFIVRVKGFLETDGGHYVVHLAGRRVNLEKLAERPHATGTRLVFISVGEEIDAEMLHRSLDDCRL